MPTSPIVQALMVFGLASCLLAFWKGGGAERIGAACIVGNIALGLLISAWTPDLYGPTLKLANDGLVAVAFLILAVLYASPWLGVAMLLYAAQFAMHSYYTVLALPKDLLHAQVNNLIFLSVILCTLTGAVGAWRRRGRIGAPGAA